MNSPAPPEDRPSTVDLVELSDLAWTIVDPAGEHEQLEQAWTAALPHDWPPPRDLEELRVRLDEAVEALRPVGEPALLEIVSAAITYLAAHPERRRVEQAVIGESLRDVYGADLPPAIEEWLSTQPTAPRQRPHGAPEPRRHLHSRPPAAPEDGRA